MQEFLSAVNWEQMFTSIEQTLLMTLVPLIIAVVLGLLLGIVLYITQKDGLCEQLVVFRILDFLVNVFRAIPFIILLFIIVPLTKLLVGTMLGPVAAIPGLTICAIPFFARMCQIAFNEVSNGTIEASKAMGASNFEIMFKIVLPESSPALVSSVAMLAINLVGYTAMAGAVGGEGLGNLAYMYGFARRNDAVLFIATAIIVVIVFLIQFVGDYIAKKVDKR